jgi:mono/diheme cytochrome c family protein
MALLRRSVGVVVGMLAVVGLGALAGGLWLVRGGVGTRLEPGRVETVLARRLRSWAIPSAARGLQSPLSPTPEVIREGMEHFADHCASCHANDGSGDTEMGKGLYPRVPDMRHADTQSLSDGELFYIIENGVRLTGMPAWGNGTPESAEASWKLVQFVRHLPTLTDAEVEAMKALKPRSPEEWREEEETRRFLEGGAEPAPKTPASGHKHGG